MKKCIICEKIKNEEEFNKEHIIPEFIGGSLTINSVCKSCNSRLGKEIDSEILNDCLIKCHVVKNKIRNKKNKEKVLFEKLISNKNPQIKLTAKRRKNGTFEKMESNTSLKSSPEDKNNHSIYFDSNKDKETVLKEIEKKFKHKYGKTLSEDEKNEIMYKIQNENTQPKIEFNNTAAIYFKKLAREFIKIAYETSHYILGEKYLDDKVGHELRESLFDKDHELIEKYTKRGMELISNSKVKEIFNELDNISDKDLIHTIEISEINNKIYLAINLFNAHINCICISETANLYNFNEPLYFILFYHENYEKTFEKLNTSDLTKKYSEILQKNDNIIKN